MGAALSVDVTFAGQSPIRGATYRVTDQWMNQDAANNNPISAFDIAAIFFDQPVAGRPSVPYDSGVNLAGAEITVVGFTGEHYPSVPFFGGSAFPIPSPYDAFRISYPLETLGGMSGGPVYTVDSANRATVRGVHTSLLVDGNGNALRFTDNILDLINFWLGR